MGRPYAGCAPVCKSPFSVQIRVLSHSIFFSIRKPQSPLLSSVAARATPLCINTYPCVRMYLTLAPHHAPYCALTQVHAFACIPPTSIPLSATSPPIRQVPSRPLLTPIAPLLRAITAHCTPISQLLHTHMPLSGLVRHPQPLSPRLATIPRTATVAALGANLAPLPVRSHPRIHSSDFPCAWA